MVFREKFVVQAHDDGRKPCAFSRKEGTSRHVCSASLVWRVPFTQPSAFAHLFHLCARGLMHPAPRQLVIWVGGEGGIASHKHKPRKTVVGSEQRWRVVKADDLDLPPSYSQMRLPPSLSRQPRPRHIFTLQRGTRNILDTTSIPRCVVGLKILAARTTTLGGEDSADPRDKFEGAFCCF